MQLFALQDAVSISSALWVSGLCIRTMFIYFTNVEQGPEIFDSVLTGHMWQLTIARLLLIMLNYLCRHIMKFTFFVRFKLLALILNETITPYYCSSIVHQSPISILPYCMLF